jgi:hypothetical protein
MLSAAEVRPAQRRRRSPYSDKQHYHEYILQRIEGYKNSIGRDELLRLGDEAASELQATAEGQFVLTEVLMLESVDRLIMKRLSLRPYRRWRQQFIKLRAAQRTPTHWGLEPHCPVAPLLPRIEPEDTALVIGTGAAPMTYLLAAHESYVAQLDQVLPEFLGFLTALDVVVLDPSVLLDLSAATRTELMQDLQTRSRPGGIHVLLPTCKAIGPHALRSLYPGWIQEEDPKRKRRQAENRRQDGLILSKPLCPPDTP